MILTNYKGKNSNFMEKKSGRYYLNFTNNNTYKQYKPEISMMHWDNTEYFYTKSWKNIILSRTKKHLQINYSVLSKNVKAMKDKIKWKDLSRLKENKKLWHQNAPSSYTGSWVSTRTLVGRLEKLVCRFKY